MSRSAEAGARIDAYNHDICQSRGGLFEPYRIAVLVPCFNEEAAIDKVVKDFRAALPAAAVFVFDNNSTDRTAEIARSRKNIAARTSWLGGCSPT